MPDKTLELARRFANEDSLPADPRFPKGIVSKILWCHLDLRDAVVGMRTYLVLLLAVIGCAKQMEPGYVFSFKPKAISLQITNDVGSRCGQKKVIYTSEHDVLLLSVSDRHKRNVLLDYRWNRVSGDYGWTFSGLYVIPPGFDGALRAAKIGNDIELFQGTNLVHIIGLK